MKYLLALTAILFTTSSLFAAEPVDLGVTMAAKMVQEKKVTVIDVRTPDEFKDGHIEGAQNISVTAEDFESKLAALDKSQPVLVHCQSGGRSKRSLETFKKLGFSNIYHLKEGFSAWEDAGQPVKK
jgi:phage shock protein E